MFSNDKVSHSDRCWSVDNLRQPLKISSRSALDHSCDPNVKSIPTKCNKRIIYAKHVIEEGEQVILSCETAIFIF